MQTCVVFFGGWSLLGGGLATEVPAIPARCEKQCASLLPFHMVRLSSCPNDVVLRTSSLGSDSQSLCEGF
eukprot:2645050-Amphidinium_carterae.1